MKQIQIIGYIGRDATIHQGNSGEFAAFSVAVSEKFKNQDGQPVDRTDWFSVTTRNVKLAQYLTKGTKVFVQGPINSRIYRRESDGQYAIDNRVSSEKIELLGGGTRQEEQEPMWTPKSGSNNAMATNLPSNDDDLPF